MKRFLSYTTAILAVAVSFSSCKDFLEKAPKTSQSTEITLSTYDGLNKATLGAYSYLANTGWYGGQRVLESEMRSGNGMKSVAQNSNRYATEINWNYTSDATSAQWAYSYFTIARANNVIDNLAGKGNPQDLNNLKAECLFIRALAHFDCVTIYSQPYTRDNGESLGVPVVLHTEASGQPSRGKVKDVYAQIVADLLEAESIIDPNYVRAGVADPKATVTVNVIRALLARVYAHMGNWEGVKTYTTKVIESGDYELYTVDNYASQWTANVGGSEVIFEIYKDMTNLSNEDCSYMTYPDGAYGDCICSAKLYNMYDDDDVRKSVYVQSDDPKKVGLSWTAKYAGKGFQVPDANNTVILRLSEMYLLRAEAAFKGTPSDPTSALADLKAVTDNRGINVTSIGEQVIMDEFRKEFAWEGHYFFDLARWGKDVVRDSDAYLQEKNANISFVQDKNRWALPLSKSELEVNPNLVQNPGY